jgi:hypothetical protein
MHYNGFEITAETFLCHTLGRRILAQVKRAISFFRGEIIFV